MDDEYDLRGSVFDDSDANPDFNRNARQSMPSKLI